MRRTPQILIGPSADRPVLSLQESQAWTEFHEGVNVDMESSVIGRVLGALQALPDILLVGAMATKKLMEVEIHGDLTQAADGVGYRAFAIGDSGIKEHARLFDLDGLNALVDAVAIWRIASVVVGQKYLHDINQNLTEIKSAVHALGEFQRDKQRSKLESSYEYLVQIERPLRDGERESAVRHRLEHIEAEMDAIQRHLRMQFDSKLDTRVPHDEMFGTEKLTEDLLNKAQSLDVLIHDHSLAGMNRLGALQMLALFPGEKSLKRARADSVRDSLLVNQKMCADFSLVMSHEVEGMSDRSEMVRTHLDEFATGKSVLHKWIAEKVLSLPIQKKVDLGVFKFRNENDSVTPRLDATKMAFQTLLAEGSSKATQRAKRVASDCASVDGQLQPRTTRYLVEWGDGQPIQISEARISG